LEALTADPPVDRFARAGARNVAGAVVSATAGVVIVLVVTNGFPREVSGTLFASTALFLLLLALCELGTDAGLARWVPTYLVAGRVAAARRTTVVATVPVAAVSAAVGVVLFVFAEPVARMLDDGPAVDDVARVLRVLAVCLPVAAVYDTALAATRAHGTITPTVLCERLGRSTGQILAVVAVQLAGGGVVALAAAWALPYVVSFVVAGLWLRAIRGGAAGDDPLPTTDVRNAFWRFTTPRAVGQVLQAALQRVDIVLVTALLGVVDGAVYTAATRFVVFGQIGTLAVQQVLQPQLSEVLASEDRDAARRLLRTATAWIMAMAWPIYLSFAIAAPVALQAFGDGYGGGSSTVVILSLAMLVATAVGPVDVVLLMSGRSGTSTLNAGLALAVDVVGVLLLTGPFDITGAAIAWAAAILVRNGLAFAQIRRHLGLTTVGRSTVTVALVVGVPFAAVAPLVRWGIDAGHDVAAALVVVAAAVAAAGLWRTRGRTGLPSLSALVPARRTRSAARA
jgi:O-antigen/teichoic acid export membrane protein